jgi:hypothetical protein
MNNCGNPLVVVAEVEYDESNPGKIGKPLTKEVFDALPADMRTAIQEYFDVADGEIKAAEAQNNKRPFVPSSDLRAKRDRVINKFGAGVYCPMKQLDRIFDFAGLNKMRQAAELN